MLDSFLSLDSLRLFLHVMAAAVWVGGQITVAGVVPALRKTSGSEGTKSLANGFAKVAWPAFVLAFLTGIWNIIDTDTGDLPSGWNATLGIKVLLVVAMGASAVAHARSTSRPVIALTGALGLLFSLVAVYLGILLSLSLSDVVPGA